MDKIRLRIHPLFLLFGVFYICIGQIFSFLAFTVSALLHELGHSFASAKRGYRLNRITLMPFGALVSGDTDEIAKRDEIIIAIAGPVTSLAIAVFFIATWWIAPELYPYTELAVVANLSLAAINLLPAFPLDGGRVLYAVLRIKLKENKAKRVIFLVSIAFSSLGLVLFIISIAIGVNLSLLFFTLFMLFGAFGIKGKNKYIKIACNGVFKRLKNGVEVKRLAVKSGMTLQKLVSRINEDYIYEISVYDDKNEKLGDISHKKLTEFIKIYPLKTTLSDIIGDKSKSTVRKLPNA